ncbi:MAG: hypothetical protein VW600_09320 [Ferrovibrio sp.]
MKKIMMAAVLLAGLALLAVLPRLIMETLAGWKSRSVSAELGIGSLSDEDKAVALARWAAGHWTEGPTEGINRLTPYLYHRYLPRLIRLPRGSIELFVMRGECDAAVAMLAQLLRSENFASIQQDFVGLSARGHSALAVSVGQKEIFLDPFFGVAFRENGRLLAFSEAQARVRSGNAVERVALKSGADFDFYDALPDLLSAKAGSPLDIVVKLSPGMDVGRIDGSSIDVENGGLKEGLSSYQHFLGARYSRLWRKIYQVESPTRLTFYLTEPASAAALPESNIAPTVKGNVVEYRIDCSQCELALDPRNVPWDWRRMKAWYDVDRLTAQPLAAIR